MNTSEIKNTEAWFDEITSECLTLVEAKNKDYGDSWKILRASSLTDQIFIKAKRIRTIQEKKENLVGDPIDKEFIGIINYCIMAIYEMDKRSKHESWIKDFGLIFEDIKALRRKKNQDYGEVWRELRISSMVDLILMKLMRLRFIEENAYVVKTSEEAFASYQDIINYSIFCLIHIKENVDPMK